MANQITVTIGRNIGTEPMPIGKWQKFIETIEDIPTLVAVETPLTFSQSFIGHGEWNGIEEDSQHFVFIFERPLSDRDLWALPLFLESAAYVYEQDAIAYSVGEATLALP